MKEMKTSKSCPRSSLRLASAFLLWVVFVTVFYRPFFSCVDDEKQQIPADLPKVENHTCPVCPECPPPPKQEAKTPTPDECRDSFQSKGQGGYKTLGNIDFCNHETLFDVCNDLRDFTGLTQDEMEQRLRRHGRFHFEGEHAFWNPQTPTELAWYYSTSVDYLFANAAHGLTPIVKILNASHAPVLDYSGGVGNNVIHLASKGIKAHYFGIGMMEYAFAEYRIRKRGYQDLVEFKRPYSAETAYKFDPVNAPLPKDGSLGAVLAIDVLEHIPNYHEVVKVMVDSLRIGGIIIELTPFSRALPNGTTDVRVHVSNGGVSMNQAMGPRMKKLRNFWRFGGMWQKVAE